MAADSFEWVLQSILTSVLSGVGFYIITRALDYAKKYCQIDRQRPIFVNNCLPYNGYWQSGLNIHRRHLHNENVCNRATALFAAYKRSSAFLCHSSPAEFDSDTSVTDNAFYGVPQWSNIDLHRAEPLPDFSLTNPLFNLSWAASDDVVTPCNTSISGIKLWSQSSHEIEDSISFQDTANLASGMCGDDNVAVGGKDQNETASPGRDYYCLQEGKPIGRRMKCNNATTGKKKGAPIKNNPENKARRKDRNQSKPMKVADSPNTSSAELHSLRDNSPHIHQAEQASLVANNDASREQGDHTVNAVPAQKGVHPNDVGHGIPEGKEIQNWSAMLAWSKIPGFQFLQPKFSLPAEDHLQAEWTQDSGCNQASLVPPLQGNMRTSHRSKSDSVEPQCDTKEHYNEKLPNDDVKLIKKSETRECKLAFISKLVKKPSRPGQLNRSPKPELKRRHIPTSISRGKSADASPDSKNSFRLSVSEKSVSPNVNKSICSSVSPFSTKGRPTEWPVLPKRPTSAEKQHAFPRPTSKKDESPSSSHTANRWNIFRKASADVINSNDVNKFTSPAGKQQVNYKKGELLSIALPGASPPSPRKQARPHTKIPRSSANVSHPVQYDANAGQRARVSVLKNNALSRCVETAKGKVELAVETAEKTSPCVSGIHDTTARTCPRGNSRRSLYSVVNKSESYFKVLKRKMTIQRKTVVTIRHQESPQVQRPHESPQVQPSQAFRKLKHWPEENRNQQETSAAGDRMLSLSASRAFLEEDSTERGFDKVNTGYPKLDVVPVTGMPQRSPKVQRSPNTNSLVRKNYQTTYVDSKKSMSKKKILSDLAERETMISDSLLQISKTVSGNTTVKTSNLRKKKDRQLKDRAKKSESRQDNKNHDFPFLPLRDYSVTVCKSRVLDTYGPLMTYHPKTSDSKTRQTFKHYRESLAHQHPVKRECSPNESLYKDAVDQTPCCSIETEPSETLSFVLPWDEKTSHKTTDHGAQWMQTPPHSDNSLNEAPGGKITLHATQSDGVTPSHWQSGQIVSSVRYRSEKQFIVSGSETTFSAVYQSDKALHQEGKLCGVEGKLSSPDGQTCEVEGEVLSHERHLRVNGANILPHQSLTNETWDKVLFSEGQLSSDESCKVVSPAEQTCDAVGEMLSLERRLCDAESQISQNWSRENVTPSSAAKKRVSTSEKLKKRPSTLNKVKKKLNEPSLNKKSSPTKKHSKSPAKSSTAKQQTRVKHAQGGSSLNQIRSKKSPSKVVDTRKFSRSPSQTKTKDNICSPQKNAPSRSIFAKKVPPPAGAKSVPRKTVKPSAVTAVKSQKPIVKKGVPTSQVNTMKKGLSLTKVNTMKKGFPPTKVNTMKKGFSPSKVNTVKKGLSPSKVNTMEARKKKSKASVGSVSEPTSRQKERPAEGTRIPKKTTSKPKAFVRKKFQASGEKKSSKPPRGNEEKDFANKPKQSEWRESKSSPRSKHGSPESSPKHASAALLLERSPPRARRSSALSSDDCSIDDVYCGRDYVEKVSAPRAQRQPPDKDRVVNLKKSALDDVVQKIQSSR